MTNEWVRASEAKPEPGIEVVIRFTYEYEGEPGFGLGFDYIDGSGDWNSGGSFGAVTHWYPLPPLAFEEKSDEVQR